MDTLHTPSGLPRTVSNPVMGVTVTFLTASDETGGEYVEAQVSIPAGDPGPPRHFHTGFEETFTAVEGVLFMDLGDRRGLRLRPGESVHVERNVRHRYFNDGDQTAVFRFVARPGTAYEMGIRAGFGLAADGRTDARGIPRNWLETALVFALSGSYVAGAPAPPQKALARVGVLLARLRGHDPALRRYTRP
ncbi:cupin domain-containing protein [Catenuloplanes japonicus]|uniref:cupin domain-containing protein n=1 Tax=Catenuloplanes japonicus TaxID=33876 RepID=UPI00068E9B28|nr:cupin domain-containing protein [Catenuloplanes japonicus]